MFSSGRMTRYATARVALAQADMDFHNKKTVSHAAFEKSCTGERHATFVAAALWLRPWLDHSDCSPETSTVSAVKLPRAATEDEFMVARIHGLPVICKFKATRGSKEPSGVHPKDKSLPPTVCKKGPDSWQVTAEV